MGIDIGPIQLIVYGFDRPKFGGGIAAELTRLKERGLVRVIDALVVHKNANGDLRTIQISDLTPDEATVFGGILGGLLGLGAGGEPGLEVGVEAGMQGIAERSGHVFDPSEWDVLEDIPSDSAAALLLIEHRWAIPLRDAIIEEGGVPIGDLWLHPRDLVAAGIIAAEVADTENREAA